MYRSERLNEAREKGIPWKKWGPYLSERHWGTVREDYSATETHGTTFRMTRRDLVCIDGAQVGWPECPMTNSNSVSRCRSEMDAISSQRNACLDTERNHGEGVKE